MDHAEPPSRTGRIGLVGGLALRAGVFYYEHIAQHYALDGRRLELVLGHADVGTVLGCVGAGDRVGLGRYLGGVANTLFDAGADLVAVTAVAPHLAIEEIAAVARGPVVDVLGLIPSALRAAGMKRVGVFGNRVVMETGVFGTVSPDMMVRPAPSVVDAVHEAYADIAANGKRGTGPEMRFLDEVARGLIGQGAEAIVLAGTDLSSFYAERAPAYPVLDVARLHIEEIVRRARGA